MNKILDNETIEYFKVDIAGKHIEIECNYRYVFNLCRDYLAKFDSPDLLIPIVSQEELDRERVNAAMVDAIEGRPEQHYSDAYLETLAVYRKIADGLLDAGILLFHAAAIAADGKCYLFMAKSGIGKTTHIRKWLKLHPETFVVNGDKPLVDIPNRMVFGTPWCGKENMNTNTSVPLGGLIWLERGEENEIERISFSEMLPCLMNQCHVPEGSSSRLKVMRLMSELQDVPCWRLRCNMDDEAGSLSYEEIVGYCSDTMHSYESNCVEKRVGVAAGKYEVPDDGFLYDDEITEMFEKI